MRLRINYYTALWTTLEHPEYAGISIADALLQEQDHLMPMPMSFDGYVQSNGRVSSTCLVAVESNRYSVPSRLAQGRIDIRLFIIQPMLKNYAPHQTELEMVTLEDLVPAEHLVRKIETAIDFEFIRDKVRHLYCPNNGRPAIDPVMLFKMILLGYLFGVRSERQLMREIQVNTAYL